jgi:MFS family permease
MIVRRESGAEPTLLWAFNLAGTAGGAILTGLAGWAIMRAGASPWKTRAALLTLLGLLLPAAALLGIGDREVVFASVLVMGAFEGWSTLLYAAVADTLPARGVCIGAAIGALFIAVVLTTITPVLGSLLNEYGSAYASEILAAVAAAGLLCIGMLAWFFRPRPALPPTAVRAAA